MARQEIPLGASPAGEGGDSARDAFERINEMTAELYTRVDTLESGKVGTSDPRLSDARDWSAATVSKAESEAGTGTTRRAWTAERVRQGVAAWWASSSMKVKLDGIAEGATANATDAKLRDRSTHTGAQPASSISNFGAAAIGALLTGFSVASSRIAMSSTDSVLVAFQKVQKYLSDLGTAAFANLTTSVTDLTVGRVLKAGDGGWMGDSVNIRWNIDDRTARGIRYCNSPAGDTGTFPPGVQYGTILAFGITNDGVIQEFWELPTSVSSGRKWWRNCYASQKWSTWAPVPVLSTMPYINLMPDSGRFGGRINPLQPNVSTFTPSTFLAAYNGGSHASGGQFYGDNRTNGGAGPALGEPVASLMAAMGRVGGGARYGIEFFVDTYTFGSGTANGSVGTDSVTRYLATTNGTRALFQAQQYATMVFWIRAKTSSFHFQFDCYKNGVLWPMNTPITISDGWVHIRMVNQSGVGYSNSWPNLCGVPGSSVHIACMAVFGGVADVGLHTSPFATINELSA